MISEDDIINLRELREKLLYLKPEEKKIIYSLLKQISNRIYILRSIESRYRKRFLMNTNYSNNYIEIDVKAKYRTNKGIPNSVKIFNNKIFLVYGDKEYEYKVHNLFDLYLLGLLIKSSSLKYKQIIYTKIDFPKRSLVIS